LKEIIKPDGTVYAQVTVEDGILLIKLKQGKYKNLGIQLDAKIIPQLRTILAQAEILKQI
jgi:hypothetical protein